LSYNWIKQALQGAGLVTRQKTAGGIAEGDRSTAIV